MNQVLNFASDNIAKNVASLLVGSAFGAGSIFAVFKRVYKNRADVKNFEYFPPQKDEKFNKKFYEHFSKCIKAAEQAIFISGDGFLLEEGSSKDSMILADEYHNAIRYALQNNVSITRIQTSRKITKAWARMLKELVCEERFNFKLYLLNEDISSDKLRSSNVLSFCVIDPDSVKCTVEIMISSRSLSGTVDSDIAGTAIFVREARDLSEKFLRHFIDITKDAKCTKVEDPEEIDSLVIESKNFSKSF